eukprot:2732022-Rhodomonas_salina.1
MWKKKSLGVWKEMCVLCRTPFLRSASSHSHIGFCAAEVPDLHTPAGIVNKRSPSSIFENTSYVLAAPSTSYVDTTGQLGSFKPSSRPGCTMPPGQDQRAVMLLGHRLTWDLAPVLLNAGCNNEVVVRELAAALERDGVVFGPEAVDLVLDPVRVLGHDLASWSSRRVLGVQPRSNHAPERLHALCKSPASRSECIVRQDGSPDKSVCRTARQLQCRDGPAFRCAAA